MLSSFHALRLRLLRMPPPPTPCARRQVIDRCVGEQGEQKGMASVLLALRNTTAQYYLSSKQAAALMKLVVPDKVENAYRAQLRQEADKLRLKRERSSALAKKRSVRNELGSSPSPPKSPKRATLKAAEAAPVADMDVQPEDEGGEGAAGGADGEEGAGGEAAPSHASASSLPPASNQAMKRLKNATANVRMTVKINTESKDIQSKQREMQVGLFGRGQDHNHDDHEDKGSPLR